VMAAEAAYTFGYHARRYTAGVTRVTS
jgi:hypothetical protein